MWIPTRIRVSIQNVLVYEGTTRTCVSTCAGGAGTRGYVLNVHGGVFESTYGGGRRHFAHQEKPM